jgi:hypothetical protein
MGNMVLQINIHTKKHGVDNAGYLEAKVNFMTDGGPNMEYPPVTFHPTGDDPLDIQDLSAVIECMSSFNEIRRSIGMYAGHKKMRIMQPGDDIRI